MAIQRKTRVAPFSTRTPFIDPTAKKDAGSKVSLPHIQYLQSMEDAINSSVEVMGTVPANSGAAGQPGTIAFDANFLYICVGLNIWKRVGLVNF